jgi:hypothetical protein
MNRASAVVSGVRLMVDKKSKQGKTEFDSVMEIIPASELPKNISFEYNSRYPSKASHAYKSMREQLVINPADFVNLNSGITIANKKYILDGGHTFKAIEDAIKEDKLDPEQVKVKVIHYDNLTPAEMARMSKGLNNKVTPPLIGQKDLEGAWDKLKKMLDKQYQKFYEFRPNTRPGAPFKVDTLVALLHAWTVSPAERCYSGKGLLVRLYSDDKYESTLEYINAAIEVFSYITKDLTEDPQMQKLNGYRERKKTTLPNGEEISGNLPQAYIWPIFASYYSLLERAPEGTDSIVRFFKKVYNEKRTQHIKQLLDDYKLADKNPTKLGKTDRAYLKQAVVVLK